MTYNSKLAVLLLSTALISALALVSAAYAHDGGDKGGAPLNCEHHYLSQDKIDLLRSTMKKVHEDNKDVFADLHQLHKERHDILAAQSFDQEAFLAVQAKIERDRDLIAQSRDAAFASIADKFTPEEREHIVRKMGHHHHHRHHHGDKKGHGWKQDEGREGWHHPSNVMNDKIPSANQGDQGGTSSAAGQ
jgi:uncharacterized membrane protein